MHTAHTAQMPTGDYISSPPLEGWGGPGDRLSQLEPRAARVAPRGPGAGGVLSKVLDWLAGRTRSGFWAWQHDSGQKLRARASEPENLRVRAMRPVRDATQIGCLRKRYGVLLMLAVGVCIRANGGGASGWVGRGGGGSRGRDGGRAEGSADGEGREGGGGTADAGSEARSFLSCAAFRKSW